MILCWFAKPQLPILDECLVLVEKECFLQRMNDLKLYLKGVRTKRMRNAVATLQTNLIPVCRYFLLSLLGPEKWTRKYIFSETEIEIEIDKNGFFTSSFS